ncbi:helix-turn-helix transcriptional regulator [Pyxidicoccus fallax]|uniref:AraC family transcriptional regulator n=1 Tax=Pyxidicoccus fallax TaxID=394095 RepID=A0A848LT67_9BACT|nr:AraC family transcriptional regulator [Pyxidicoccus fallax]NMO20869.1 AraC family transcriptional regulator [Pyxidicoccus fallax]NPC86994.1 helix-turn-helix transcriptional regulator [Pyxidicoccus fallax]
MGSAFDELSRSLDVRGSEITHLELSGKWGKHRRSAPGKARLYATVHGEWTLELPQQRVQLRAGELAFLPHHAEHVIRDALTTFVARDGSACEGMRQVSASAWANTSDPSSRLVIVDLELDARDAPWVGLLAPLVVIPREESGLGRWLRETLSLLAGSYELSPSLRQEISTAWARALFAHALRDATAALPGADVARDERVVAALVQARARPEEDWELGELAARVGVSRSVLAERTTALLGEPLGHYLRRLRIERAAALLGSTDTPVKTIAARVGYDSESSFARAFSRVLGVSPTAWRRVRRGATA